MSAVGAVLLVDDGGPSPELEAQLGAERATALQTELTEQATSWARGLGADCFQSTMSSSSLAAQVEARFAGSAGAVIVVWPRALRLGPEHAAGVLGDLEAGCDLVLGPMVDGGFYLLALSRPSADVIALLQDGFQTPAGTPGALATAAQSGLELGYLRPERGLRSGDDVRAAVADPLTAPAIRRILDRV